VNVVQSYQNSRLEDWVGLVCRNGRMDGVLRELQHFARVCLTVCFVELLLLNLVNWTVGLCLTHIGGGGVRVGC
jgi:hypothetical protein